MSPQQTAAPLDVAAAMDAQDERLARLARRLARLGELDRIDAIFGGDMPRLLLHRQPHMERGAS